MKRKITACLVALSLYAGHYRTAAQGTAFSYQGRLNDGGNPANGTYDLTFQLWNDSTAGSEVGSTLTDTALGVTNGLFTVRLDFGSVFDGTTYWLQIGVRTNGGGSFTTLSPRQQLTPDPYAIYSEKAGLADTLANGTVSPMQLNTAGAPGTGQVLGYNGSGLAWMSPASVAFAWNLTGNAGTIPGVNFLGTSDNQPLELHVAGGRALRLEPEPGGGGDVNVIGGSANNSVGTGSWGNFVGAGSGNSHAGSVADSVIGGGFENAVLGSTFVEESFIGGGGLNTIAGSWDAIGGGFENSIANGAGFATICGGVNNTNSAFFASIGGGANNTISAQYATIAGGYNNQANGEYSFVAGQGAVSTQPGSFVFADSQSGGFTSVLPNEVCLRADNGLYMATQRGVRMDAQNCPMITRGWDPFTGTAPNGKTYCGRWGLFMEPGSLTLGIPNTDVPGGYRQMEVARYNPDGSRDTLLSVGNNGITTVKVITITGGSDVAEPFPMAEDQTPEGAVVVIDEEAPGHLKMSSVPYDTHVAGIVSGANGIHPGLALHQTGALDEGQNVALSGRVYVLADASNSPIRPGDLLTSSNVPGHAMRAVDHARAQGAIIGKAMTRLDSGRGMVLVLVSLQ